MQGAGAASLLALPIDATLRMFAFLDISDLMSVVSTCKALRDLGKVCIPPKGKCHAAGWMDAGEL